jgi:hypothetical protein
MRLLLTAFFLETGLVLLLAPWSQFWDRNYFAQGIPLIHGLLINNFVRGAVSGLGIVNIIAAIAEMHAFFAERRVQDSIITLTHTSSLDAARDGLSASRRPAEE